MKSDIWKNVKDSIFFTTPLIGWQKEWDILMFNDEPVTNLEVAKHLVREHMKTQTVGLATFEQMCLNNAEWDNI